MKRIILTIQQKWSKGKTREKVSNSAVFDKTTYDRLLKEIPPARLITPSTISEKLKVNGSLARRAIKDLASKGLIKEVSSHSSQLIYTRATIA